MKPIWFLLDKLPTIATAALFMWIMQDTVAGIWDNMAAIIMLVPLGMWIGSGWYRNKR
jgi:hypothetical protein